MRLISYPVITDCRVIAFIWGIHLVGSSLSADPLKTADELDRKVYKGWVYGPDQSKKQIDCSQFIVAVVEAELGKELKRVYRNAINIHPPPPDLNQAIQDDLGLMRGVHYALIDLLKIGKHIEPEYAQPGDFVQYWKKNENGDWRGHAAIIHSVWEDTAGNKRASIMGAHKPQPGETDFICIKDFDGEGVNLQEPGRLVYIVRLNESATLRNKD